MNISYGITVCNEADELNRLLDILLTHIDSEDEIVICVDGNDDDVQFILDRYEHHERITMYRRKLDKDFAAQKNSVIENCKGDYIFHLDADEYPHEILLSQIKLILEMNEADLVWIPRVNTVEGITNEHCVKWGWRINDKGWINYPDYQARVFKRSKDIRWIKPVHEYIIGCKTYAHLPPQEELSLYHYKTIDKQEQQNKLYEKILTNN